MNINNILNSIGYRNTKSYLFYSTFAFMFFMILNGSDFHLNNITDLLNNLFWLSNIFMISMSYDANSKNVFFTLPVTRKEYITSIYIGEIIQVIFVTLVALGLKFISIYFYKHSSLLNYTYTEIFFMCILIGTLYKIILIPFSIRYSSINKSNFLILMICIGLTIPFIQTLSYVVDTSFIGKFGINIYLLTTLGIFINLILLLLSYKISISFLSKKEVV